MPATRANRLLSPFHAVNGHLWEVVQRPSCFVETRLHAISNVCSFLSSCTSYYYPSLSCFSSKLIFRPTYRLLPQHNLRGAVEKEFFRDFPCISVVTKEGWTTEIHGTSRKRTRSDLCIHSKWPARSKLNPKFASMRVHSRFKSLP